MQYQSRHHGCRISEVARGEHTLLVLENESVRVTVLLTKGAEIVEFRFKPLDLDVLWHTAGMVPARSRGVSTGGSGLEGFFDQYCGCWQESFPVGNTAGNYKGAPLGVHGEVSLLPWNYEVVRDAPDTIEVDFSVRCVRTPFELTRRMSLRKGSAAVRFVEQVTNRSGMTLEYAWGHHPAFGPPFLTDKCVIDWPSGIFRTPADSTATSRFAPGQTSRLPRLLGTGGDWIDLRLAPPARGGTTGNVEVELRGPGRVAIRNPTIDLGFGMKWDRKVFPHLWGWESSRGGSGYPLWRSSHHLALEPFNCPIGGLVDFEGKQVLPRIRGNATHSTGFIAGFCDGRSKFTGSFQ